MKYVVILVDGMGDEPLIQLSGKTPLETAKTKWMDFIARNGKSGLLQTLSKDLPLGSDVANLSILGYDPKSCYYGGRGPFEALSLKVPLKYGDIVARFNFITENEGRLKHYSAGGLSDKENKKLVSILNKKLGNYSETELKFYSGGSYKGFLVINDSKKYSAGVTCKYPHEIKNESLEDNLYTPKNKSDAKALSTTTLFRDISFESKKILSDSMINKKRLSKKKLPANMIWLWSPGVYKKQENFQKKFKIPGKCAIISAIPLLRGIGMSIGLDIVDVPNITSSFNFNTNYKSKADNAVKAILKGKKDFIYVHIKAPDDLSHNKELLKEIKAIEKVDRMVVGKILKILLTEKIDFKIAVLPDHRTSTKTGKHMIEPVPFAVYSSVDKSADDCEKFTEKEAGNKGSFGLLKGSDFMKLFILK